MTTALVTGASGFIGSHLVEALGKRQVEVRALLRSSSKTNNLDGLRYERADGHLGDIQSLRVAVRDVDVVFHLAGATAAPNAEAYMEANAHGTRRLLEACAEEQARTGRIKRVVLVSSLAAIGPSLNDAPIDESSAVRPLSDYGKSKLQGELEALRFRDQVPLTILRPPIVFGPKDKQVFLIVQGVSRRIVPLLRGATPSGDKYYASVYSDDLVQALILAGLDKTDLPSGEAFFITSEDNISFRSMIDQIGEALGVRAIKVPVSRSLIRVAAHVVGGIGRLVGKSFPFNEDKLNDIMPDYWICSSAKAKRLLGYKPKATWRSGMRETVSWCRKSGWLASLCLWWTFQANGAEFTFPMVEKTLSNGLRVVLVEDKTFPVISYQTWFRVGSVDETIGATGLAHLFEHLMFKGTKAFGPKEFFNQLETRGAQVNAFTTRDYTAYYQNFSPPLLPKVIELESDRMQGLILTQALLDTERSVVFEERRMRTDNSPAGRMQEALWLLSYKTHPYRFPIIGLPQDLANLGVEQMVAFYKKFYVPANAILVVVGAFDPKKTMALIEKSYGAIPKGATPDRSHITNEPAPDSERQLQLEDEIASEQFSIGYPIPSASDPESYAVDVLSNILFEGMSSRATLEIVERKNIASGIAGSSFTPTYPGLLMIAGVMRAGKPSSEAIASLDGIIETVKKSGVTDAEVQKSVRQLTIQTYGQIRTGHGLGQMIGVALTVLGPKSPIQTLVQKELEKYRTIKPADVQRVAQQFLQPNARSIVFLKPRSKP